MPGTTHTGVHIFSKVGAPLSRFTMLVFAGCVLPVLTAMADEYFQVSLSQTESGTYSVADVLIEGQVKADFLLDTGASYASISRQTFRQLKDAAEPEIVRHIHGALADGKVVKVPVYRLGSLRLSEGCEVRDIEVVVLGNSGRDILGMNVLSRLQPLTMSLEPPSLAGNCSDLLPATSHSLAAQR